MGLDNFIIVEDDEYEKHWKGVQKFFKVAAKYNASIGGWW